MDFNPKLQNKTDLVKNNYFDLAQALLENDQCKSLYEEFPVGQNYSMEDFEKEELSTAFDLHPSHNPVDDVTQGV